MEMFSANNTLRHCLFSRVQSHLNWLWRKRLSHLNFKNILKIYGNQLVKGIPKMHFVKDKLCSACEKGKKTKSSFKPKSCSSITKTFHLFHMDLFGPIAIKSRSGKKFTLIIVDEYSIFTWVIFLRKKAMLLMRSSLSLSNVKFFMTINSGNYIVIIALNS